MQTMQELLAELDHYVSAHWDDLTEQCDPRTLEAISRLHDLAAQYKDAPWPLPPDPGYIATYRQDPTISHADEEQAREQLCDVIGTDLFRLHASTRAVS